MCKYLDKNANVIKWASEEVSIPYISPIDKKHHKYYPDFLAEIKQKSGSVQTFLIEIKPEKQTKPPTTKNKRTKTHNINMKTFVINDAKWKAAEKFCSDNDWKFTVLTEKHLFKGNKWG